VLVTYDEFGAYGHPDHIKCNLVTHRAFDLAGEAGYAPELGEPWTPLKLYYTHWNEEGWLKARDMYKERGLKWPWDEEEQQDPDPEHQSIEEAVAEEVEQVVEEAEGAAQKGEQAQDKPPEYVPPPVTTRINVRAMLSEKMESIRQHRTQFDPEGLFTTMPADIAEHALGEEHYSLVATRIPAPQQEDDLLAGLS
jgi:mycothiol S-conjugate amidase